MLITFPLLDDATVQHLRQLLQDAHWSAGRTTAGPQAAQAKNNEQLPADSDTARQAGALVLAALDRSPTFLAAALPRRIVPPRFNRYAGERNAFGEHVDGAIRYAQPGVAVRSDISCTVFLAEPGSYDGGELVIHEAGSERAVKLPAGHAVLYPATHVHAVRPVTRGERLASHFWVESMVRSQEQRRLLYEFDLALMALRARDGDDATTVALAGTYHNLLRMWAST